MQFLKKSKTGIAVGTPARLEALLDNGELLSPLRGSQNSGFSNASGRRTLNRVLEAHRG